jgi:hypothetical protein
MKNRLIPNKKPTGPANRPRPVRSVRPVRVAKLSRTPMARTSQLEAQQVLESWGVNHQVMENGGEIHYK